MRDSHILDAFTRASGGTCDNSYSRFNASANGLLNFDIPRGGVELTLSRVLPQFSSSYKLGVHSTPIDGAISYLYSTVPLTEPVSSDKIPLVALFRSYRPLTELITPPPSTITSRSLSSFLRSPSTRIPGVKNGTGASAVKIRERSHQAKLEWRLDEPEEKIVKSLDTPATKEATLFYGRLYLPKSELEALISHRVNNTLQLQLKAFSQRVGYSGTLGSVRYDRGKWGVEGMVGSADGMIGLSGVYNIGSDPSPRKPLVVSSASVASTTIAHTTSTDDRILGRWSIGSEIYYGIWNHFFGVSFGSRFATLPTYQNGSPITATLSVNPLIGEICGSYRIEVIEKMGLATSMAFNVFSYESEWAAGIELWRFGKVSLPPKKVSHVEKDAALVQERSFQAKMEWRLDDKTPTPGPAEEPVGVLKTRIRRDSNGLNLGLVYQSRYKSAIFCVGTELPAKASGLAVGLEIFVT